MTRETTIDDLKRYRALVETGSVLDKNTVLNIISHAGEAAETIQRKQEAMDTVARIVETQCEAVVRATDSYDVIDDDFDGDWDAVWSRLAELADQKRQAERNADTYQKLYEQRAESLEQAELERDEWRGKFDEAETARIYSDAQVDRVREVLSEVQTRGESIRAKSNNGSIYHQERAARGEGYLEATRLAFLALGGDSNA